MALLTRFLPMNDANETQVFSFIVTKSVTRDLNRDVVSKEFSYGSQKWAISFSRQEKTLGFFLVWKNPSENLRVSLDIKFTLINRENFLENRDFSLDSAAYRASHHTNGNKSFIRISELLTHRPRFVDTNGEFLVQLRLSRIKTFFEKEFLVMSNEEVPIVSSDFFFGAFNWVLNLKPSPFGLSVYLERLKIGSNSDSTISRISYRFSIQDEISERKEDMIFPEHSGSPWNPKLSLQKLFSRSVSDGGGYLKVLIDLYSCHPITEFVHSLEASKEIQGDGELITVRSFQNGNIKAVDKDNCSWSLDGDLHSGFLRFSLVFKDVDKILRNHLRFIQWKSYLVRRPKKWRGLRDDKEQRELVDFQSGSVFSRYYSQDEFDPGVIMETTIPTKDIKEGLSEFLEDENTMRIRIQWDYNYQLFQSTFHQYDDVYRYQNQQMKVEIDSLNEKVRSLELLLEGERGTNNEEALKIRTLTVGDPVLPLDHPSNITRSPSPVPIHLRRMPVKPSRSPSPRAAGRKLTISQFSLDGSLLLPTKSLSNKAAVFRRGNSTYAEATESPNGSQVTPGSELVSPSSLGSPSPSTPPPLITGTAPRFGISPPLKRFLNPLQTSLSLSAESISSFKKSVSKTQMPTLQGNNGNQEGRRASGVLMSKCQSID